MEKVVDSSISSTPYIHVNSTLGMVSHATFIQTYIVLEFLLALGLLQWSTQGATGEETKVLRLARFHFVGCFIAPFSISGKSWYGRRETQRGRAGCPGGPYKDNTSIPYFLDSCSPMDWAPICSPSSLIHASPLHLPHNFFLSSVTPLFFPPLSSSTLYSLSNSKPASL